MTTDTNNDVMLMGGPQDGALVNSIGSAVVELEIDGLVHSYVLTDRHTERDGSSYTIFKYNGMTDPGER